jgi:hypothetical protein
MTDSFFCPWCGDNGALVLEGGSGERMREKVLAKR